MLIAAVRCDGPDHILSICYAGISMPSRYAQWMYDWETRLTSVDDNRVVRPLDWGVEWARDWPCRNGYALGHIPENGERYLSEYNRRIIASSDEFFSYLK